MQSHRVHTALPGIVAGTLLAVALAIGGCSAGPQDDGPGGGTSTSTLDLMKARNLTEAILWHDGEAAASREAFAQMSAAERAALIAFLNSL